jgi:hypothetical protein
MSIRPDYILHQLPVTEWTEEEGFELACRDFPDVMEPYAVQIADITERQSLKRFMRSALAQTIGDRRYSRRLAAKMPEPAA